MAIDMFFLRPKGNPRLVYAQLIRWVVTASTLRRFGHLKTLSPPHSAAPFGQGYWPSRWAWQSRHPASVRHRPV